MIINRHHKLKVTLAYLFLIAFILFTLMPYAWMILTSFKKRVDAFAIPPKIFFDATLSNYYDVFITKGMIKNLGNSIIVMLVSVAIVMILGLPSAFAFSAPRRTVCPAAGLFCRRGPPKRRGTARPAGRWVPRLRGMPGFAAAPAGGQRRMLKAAKPG